MNICRCRVTESHRIGARAHYSMLEIIIASRIYLYSSADHSPDRKLPPHCCTLE